MIFNMGVRRRGTGWVLGVHTRAVRRPERESCVAGFGVESRGGCWEGGCSLCLDSSMGTVGTCLRCLPLPQALCEPLTHIFTSVAAEVPLSNGGAHKERYKEKLRKKPRSRDWKSSSSCPTKAAAGSAGSSGSSSLSCVWLS